MSAELYVGEATTTQRSLRLAAGGHPEMAQVIPLRTVGTGYEVEARAERHASDQAWFWTPEWQEGEREVDEAIAAGRTTYFDSADEFLAALDRHTP